MRVRVVAAILVVLLAASSGSLLLSRRLLLDRLDDEIRVDLQQESEEFLLLVEGVDPQTGEAFGGDVRAIFDVYFAREVPDEGESLFAFVDGMLYKSIRAQDGAAFEQVGDAVRHWLSLDRPTQGAIMTAAGDARYVAIPVDGDPVDGLFVVANFPAFERAEINGAFRAQAAAQLTSFAVAALLGIALAGQVLRPLRSLVATARSITETDLSRRIPARGRDEASEIARAFNDMLGRLERAFTGQRRFLDEVGHELRSPLTIIRGNFELLDIADPEERQEVASLIFDEISRMERMVDELLLLARAEQPDFLRPQPFDLHEFTVDVYRKSRALAPRDWRVNGSGQATVVADRQLLTQAIIQLAHNACQHTDEGTRIEIGSAIQDRLVHLWVHDHGPGIAPNDIDRIFQRFARGSGHRAASGAGLGLAIVRAIAEAHNGRARLAPSDVGARFEIVMPLHARHDLPPSHSDDAAAVSGGASS